MSVSPTSFLSSASASVVSIVSTTSLSPTYWTFTPTGFGPAGNNSVPATFLACFGKDFGRCIEPDYEVSHPDCARLCEWNVLMSCRGYGSYEGTPPEARDINMVNWPTPTQIRQCIAERASKCNEKDPLARWPDVSECVGDAVTSCAESWYGTHMPRSVTTTLITSTVSSSLCLSSSVSLGTSSPIVTARKDTPVAAIPSTIPSPTSSSETFPRKVCRDGGLTYCRQVVPKSSTAGNVEDYYATAQSECFRAGLWAPCNGSNPSVGEKKRESPVSFGPVGIDKCYNDGRDWCEGQLQASTHWPGREECYSYVYQNCFLELGPSPIMPPSMSPPTDPEAGNVECASLVTSILPAIVEDLPAKVDKQLGGDTTATITNSSATNEFLGSHHEVSWKGGHLEYLQANKDCQEQSSGVSVDENSNEYDKLAVTNGAAQNVDAIATTSDKPKDGHKFSFKECLKANFKCFFTYGRWSCPYTDKACMKNAGEGVGDW